MSLTGPRLVAALAALTAAAFLLRALSLGEALFGDELYTYDIITGRSLGEVLELVRETSVTPPLHYVLAWLSVQPGAPEVTIRLPSLLLGTATVPLLYLLGAMTAGRGAGLVAAALYALGPFAIFYGSEGRAYATLVFLIVLALVCLLRAVRGGGWGWWAAYAVAAAGALYTHYTGVFPIAAGAAWALWVLWPQHRRVEWLLAHAAAAVLYLPWVPFWAEQRRNPGIAGIESLVPFTAHEFFGGLVRVVLGSPFEPLGDVPGTAGLVALVLALVAGVALAVRLGPPPLGRREAVLLVALLLATPAGIVLYSLGGTSIYAPRTLLGALPAMLVLLGWLVARRPPVAVALLAVALLVAAGTSLRPSASRPAFDAAAERIEQRGGPRDPVVITSLFAIQSRLGRGTPQERGVEIHFDRPRDVTTAVLPDRSELERAAAAARTGDGRLWVVSPGLPFYEGDPAPPELPGARLVSREVFPGVAPVAVFELRVR